MADRRLHQAARNLSLPQLRAALAASQVKFESAQNSRDHKMKGVRWLFGAAGVSGTLYTFEKLQPGANAGDALRGAVVGIIPGAMALAHFFCSWLCARQSGSVGMQASRPTYRAASRRF